MCFSLVIVRNLCEEGCFSVKPKIQLTYTLNLAAKKQALYLYIVISQIVSFKTLFLTLPGLSFLNKFGRNIVLSVTNRNMRKILIYVISVIMWHQWHHWCILESSYSNNYQFFWLHLWLLRQSNWLFCQ